MAPLFHLDPTPRWRPAARNSSKRAGFDASGETDVEKEQRIACVVGALTRFCQKSRDGKFRPHHPEAYQKEFLIATVVPYTLKSIVADHHHVFELHQEEGFRWSVSLKTLEIPSAPSVETQMVIDIMAIAPSFATSSGHHDAENAPRTIYQQLVSNANRNHFSTPLGSVRNYEVAPTQSESAPAENAQQDSSAETMSPSPEPHEVVNNWRAGWQYDGVPRYCACGWRINRWEEACSWCRAS